MNKIYLAAKKRYVASRRERGIAVLFSLGIMAIVMVIVVLFSDFAMNEKKVANANDNTRSAKILAASILNRVKIAADYASANDFSTDTLVSRNTNSADSDFDFIYKLECDSVDFGNAYDSSKITNPVWKYIKIKDKDGSNRIIARYAYMSCYSDNKLNMNYLADCFYSQNGSKVFVPTGDIPSKLNTLFDSNGLYGYCTASRALKTPSKLSDEYRLGHTINELRIDPVSVTGGNITSEKLRTKKAASPATSWGDAATLIKNMGFTVNDSGKYIVNRDFAFTAKKDPEVFFAGDINKDNSRSDDEFYHRFNVCVPLETWNEWAETAADKAPYTNNDNEREKQYWVFLKDPVSYAADKAPEAGTYGIPFFRNWNDSCGMVHNIGTSTITWDDADGRLDITESGKREQDGESIKAARNQVMANILNMFAESSQFSGQTMTKCDDIPPISDVPASEWKEEKKDAAGKLIHPTYTGNKRTLYLNEIFVAIKLTASYDQDLPTEAAPDIIPRRTYRITSQLFTGAEMVRMFDAATRGESTWANLVNNGFSPVTRSSIEYAFPFITGYFTANVDYACKSGINDDDYKSKDFCKVEEWCNWEDADNGAKYAQNVMYGRYDGNESKLADKSENKNNISFTSGGLDSINCYPYVTYYRGGAGTAAKEKDEEWFKINLTQNPDGTKQEDKFGYVTTSNKNGIKLRNLTFHPKKFILTNNKIGVPNGPCKGMEMNVDYAHLPDVNIGEIDFNLPDQGSKTIWVYFTLQANDPRQNLNPCDWTLKKGGDKNIGSTGAPGILQDEASVKKEFFYPRVNSTITHEGTAGIDYDKERNYDPAFWANNGMSSYNIDYSAYVKSYQSSACMPYHPSCTPDPKDFFPCTTLWQLGSVHRAKAWQTINLKKAQFFDSSKNITDMSDSEVKTGSYTDGDALLLDQLKLTPSPTVNQKINLYVDNAEGTETVKKLYKSLFRNWTYFATGQMYLWAPNQMAAWNWLQFYPVSSSKYIFYSKDYVDENSGVIKAVYDALEKRKYDSDSGPKFERRTDMLSVEAVQAEFMKNGENDAQQEEAAGRIINLTKYEPVIDAKMLNVSIVVQTIDDYLSGTTYYPGGDEVWDDRQSATKNNAIGKAKWNEKMAGYVRPDGTRFTPGSNDWLAGKKSGTAINATRGTYNLYADKITGEAKINATLVFDPVSGKWQIKGYEYVE